MQTYQNIGALKASKKMGYNFPGTLSEPVEWLCIPFLVGQQKGAPLNSKAAWHEGAIQIILKLQKSLKVSVSVEFLFDLFIANNWMFVNKLDLQ